MPHSSKSFYTRIIQSAKYKMALLPRLRGIPMGHRVVLTAIVNNGGCPSSKKNGGCPY
jgi:hypothetical protein